MDDLRILLDAPGEPTGRLQIATLGDFNSGKYGEFSITRDDVTAWQRNLEHLPGQRALIDLDHQADRTPRKTEAAGWITNIGWDGETPVADVEWTPVGEQAIKDKRYLFFSPTYGEHKNERGEVFENTLLGGALTNRPFLSGMPAITLASEETVQAAIDDLQSDNDLRLLDLLTASRPEPAAPVSTSADSRPPMSTALLKTLGLPEDADEQKLLDTVAELQESAKQADKLQRKLEKNPVKTLEQQAKDAGLMLLDTAKVTELTQQAADGARALQQLHESRFETAFELALQHPEGPKVTPAEHDSLKHFYTLDADATLKLIEDRKPILPAKPSGNPTVELDADADPNQVAAAGLHPASHALDRRIRKYMLDNKVPERDYAKTLDQYVSGAVAL